jgi:methionyl aminopeptidase
MTAYGERIAVKTRREIDWMREAARHVAEILLELRELAKPGVTTGELNAAAERSIERRGVVSSFKGYGPHGLPQYPAAVCISVNDEIVHGIPGRRELRDGDVLSLDFGVSVHGYHGDSAVTVPVGTASEEVCRLLEATRASLYSGIEQVQVGNRVSDIGHAVQKRAEGEGYSVVRQFVGHGIGAALHEPPQIPNFGAPGRGARLRPGMALAIEPMVCMGGAEVRILDDEWTAVTADGSLSAHFEHTVLVTDGGPEILTRIEGSH